MEDSTELSLYELLERLDQHDQGFLQLTPETVGEYMQALLSKVDNWRYYLDSLQDSADRSKAYATEHLETANNSLNKLERAEKRLVDIMRINGFSKLQGNEFVLTLRKSKRVEIKGGKVPTDRDWTNYPSLVNCKYSWKKEDLKRLIEADKCPFSFVKITEHFSPSFKTKE